VILENVADERGEPAAKVARTLVRLGCDLYLRFGPSREPYIGENFFPEHPTVEMKYKIDPGDYTLTKESQEVVIKRLGRGDFTTLGLLVWIYTKVDSSITVPYQIELTETDESICVVVDPEDVSNLPPPSTYQTAPGSMYPTPPEKKIIENFEGKNSSKRKGEKEDHTLIIWEAMQSLDNDLKKEAKPTMIWNYLRKNINKYNTNGVIISISHDVMKYFKSNATEGHLTKESFRKAIKRLRENPPK
ncbi:uncharacterized protein METZ01_LOCUS271568, partial [marine metagenome]